MHKQAHTRTTTHSKYINSLKWQSIASTHNPTFEMVLVHLSGTKWWQMTQYGYSVDKLTFTVNLIVICESTTGYILCRVGSFTSRQKGSPAFSVSSKRHRQLWGERNCVTFKIAVGGNEPLSPRLAVWRSTVRPPLPTLSYLVIVQFAISFMRRCLVCISFLPGLLSALKGSSPECTDLALSFAYGQLCTNQHWLTLNIKQSSFC